MTRNHIAHPFRRQMILSILLLLGFGALPVFLIGKAAVDRIDAAAAERELKLVNAAVSRRFTDLAVEQRSATIWDEAVHMSRDGNVEWQENNLGIWMQKYFGHDMNFVFDPALLPTYAAVGRETVPADAFRSVAPAIRPLVEEAKDLVLRGDLDPEEIAVTSYVNLGTGPALASVVPIVPDTDRLEVAPADTYFHVAVDTIDADFVSSVTDDLGLVDPRVSAPDGGVSTGVSMAMADASGPIARLGWTPARPAQSLVAALLPALGVWVAAGALLVMYLARHLIRTSWKLQKSEARSKYLAFHDPLTRLPNRALFEDRLQQALASVDRGGPDVTLLLMDLDRFKAVNDTMGHPAGDALLRKVGERISGRIRRSDSVARLGGDEFAVVLVGHMPPDALAEFCATLIEDISRPYDLAGMAAHISASIGAVRARAVGGDAEEMLRCADIALYRSKHGGRRRFCMFSEGMDAEVKLQSRVERDLRADLDNRTPRLGLGYQPLVDLQGQLAGATASLCWDHPEHGDIPVATCFRIAEDRGFCNALGRHLLEQACDFVAMSGVPKVVVLISHLQLHDTSFAQTVLRMIETAGIAPARLELRLPEGVVRDGAETCRRQLEMLRAAGVGISLDERATAHFDLGRAREMGVDSVTIGLSCEAPHDRSVDKDIGTTAMIDFAKTIGLRVTATGIRTDAERDGLAERGCAAFHWDGARGMTPDAWKDAYGVTPAVK